MSDPACVDCGARPGPDGLGVGWDAWTGTVLCIDCGLRHREAFLAAHPLPGYLEQLANNREGRR
jgi:hypothetical protein